MKNLTPVSFTNVEIKDNFWSERLSVNQEKTLKANYEHLKKQGRIDAWTWKKGQPNKPHIFWDSDVAKWIEAVSYHLANKRNKSLENKAWSAAVHAEVARGKAGGLYIDQKLVMTGNLDNLSTDEIKDRLKKIIDDNKEIVNITPEDIELDTLELQEESNPDSHSQEN